jgi:hypothetical protein
MASGRYPDSGGSLADGAVTTAKVADGAVTPAKTSGIQAGWTRVDISSTVQDYDLAIAGETVYAVEVVLYLVNAAAGGDSDIFLRPNNVSTNQECQDFGVSGTSVAGSRPAVMRVCYAGASGKGWARFLMVTKKDTLRLYSGVYQYFNSSNALQAASNVIGVWKDTSTTITSLRFHSGIADGIGTGSYILWRAVPLAV